MSAQHLIIITVVLAVWFTVGLAVAVPVGKALGHHPQDPQ